MCHCEDLSACKRTSLNRVDFLYDNELDSDVVFLAGVEPDVWRIPGHKKILCEANSVFRALLEGPLATNEKTVVIEDVEGRAFDYLLRYLYGKEVHFQSATTALNTLYAAHKYLCSDLVQLCVKYLNKNLSAKNVLEIYTHARLYAMGSERIEFQPSAPMATTEMYDLHTPTHYYVSSENNNNNCRGSSNNNNNNNNVEKSSSLQTSSISVWSDALVYDCLECIDANAEKVLGQEGIEDLSADNLMEIIKRDTLKIKSELDVFAALDRWANRECKRRKLNLSSKNRRLVLNELIYEIRFPFFTSEEFVLGPIQSGWLDPQELSFFSAVISKSKCLGQIPNNWKSYMDKICRKRNYYADDNMSPSPRTYILDSERFKERDSRKNNSIFRKMKGKNGKSTKEKSSAKSCKDENKRSCGKCFPEFMVDILVCLFD